MSKLKQRVLTLIRVVLAVGLLAYLAASGALEWSALLGLLESWPLTATALALITGALFLTAWRLCVLFAAVGFGLTLSASTRLTLIGAFFNTCLPGSGGGDIVRIYYATLGNEGKKTEVVTIMLLDRVVGLFGLLLAPLLLAPFFWPYVAAEPSLLVLCGAAALGILVLLGVLVIGSWQRISSSTPVTWLLERVPAGAQLKRMLQVIAAYRSHGGSLLRALALSLGAHALTISVILLLTKTISDTVNILLAMVIPLGFVANAVPLTPGGLGVGEAAFEALFRIAGVDGGAEIMLGWRVLMVLMGLVGLAFYIRGRRRFVHAAAPQAGRAVDSETSPSDDLVPMHSRGE